MILTLAFSSGIVSAPADAKEKMIRKDPKGLIKKMVQSLGPAKKWRSLKDVEYTYIYRDRSSGEAKEDISLERYIFDGELSWAKYTKRQAHVLPDQSGDLVQGFDGREAWTTLNGQLLTDPQTLKMAKFLRKTNYYWFAMMSKLLDPGLLYSYEGTRTVGDVEYDLVKINFEVGVGDVSDTYLLYINPRTHLVDQFLFTVMDFGMTTPFLMKVEYEEVAGVKLPAKRKYVASNWAGEVLKDQWSEEMMTDIKFNNGFSKTMFKKPWK